MSDRNSQVSVLLIKTEVTEGTDPVPGVADAIAVNEPIMAHGEHAFKTERPKLVIGSAIQASPPLTPKGLQGTWQNTNHLRGPGSAYAAGVLPETDPWWQSAGFSATLVVTPGSEKVTYKPAATALKSHAEYAYVDGRLKKLLAAKSELEFGFSAGGPVVLTAKRTGLYTSGADTAVIASPTYDTTVPPVVDNVALTFNGFAAGIIRRFKCTIGNHIAQRPNANATGGLSPHKVRSRVPKFELVLEDELVAAIDFEALKANRTLCAFSWFINAAQYNRLRFIAGTSIVEDVKVADDNGTQITTITGGLYDSAFGANDAVQVAFE